VLITKDNAGETAGPFLPNGLLLVSWTPRKGV